MKIKVETLAHDVPVDSDHVKVLAASMKERGQLAPILIRREDHSVIDGFHRLTALRNLGAQWATCEQIECDLEAFRNARIISASMHKAVSFARVTLWVREIFADTNWETRLTAEHAFRLSGKVPGRLGSDAFKKALRSGLSQSEVYEVVKWSREKAAVWGLTPEQIANMLEIADLASPYLAAYVRPRKHSREEVLTRPMLAAIVKAVPDHAVQEAVAKKAMTERLNEKETRRLVLEVAEAETDRAQLDTLLSTSWLKVQRDKVAKRVPVTRLSDEERAANEEYDQAWWTVGMLETAANALRELPPITNSSLAAKMDEVLVSLLAAIGSYRGYDGDPTAVEMLTTENHRQVTMLMACMNESAALKSQVTKLERQLNLGQRMYQEDAS